MARRYMDSHGLNPAETAMGVLIQPLIEARASGGGLSKTAEGQMLLSATWGLGSAIAQGEVVPDRILLTRQGFVRKIEAGRKDHRDTCGHGAGAAPQKVASDLVSKPCLDHAEATALGRMLLRAEQVIGGPAEIEWAMDEAGFKLLQARPLHVQPIELPDEIWLRHPKLNGHPAGIGWGSGRAVVINCECELARVAPGDVLVTRVAGPAPSSADRPRILPRSRASEAFRWCWVCSTPRRKFPTERRSQSTALPASCGGYLEASAHLHHASDRRQCTQAAARRHDRHRQRGFEPHHRQAEADRGGEEGRHPVHAAA
jgi:hypothetical protein